MAAQLYPIGIQYFPEIIERGFTYVDKTRFVGKLVKECKYIFLSRPRRFGKSLLLSTFHAYFDGRRELFRGLAIDSMDMDWTPSPVLHFDLNSGLYGQPDGLEEILGDIMSEYEKRFEVVPDTGKNVSSRFRNLIREIHAKTGRKVAILVDEYDKPLLNIEENPGRFERNQAILKAFFSNLKSMDGYIRFAMLTGVARFSKVSIFSDLNNLNDISMQDEYQEICGWTEDELKANFMPGIEALAMKRHESAEDSLDELRRYYDGYLFSKEGTRLYNPFSLLMSLSTRDIVPYWFETGTPTFLAKRIRKSGINPADINGQTQRYNDLISVGLGTSNVMSLMFQTGYLTVDTYDFRRQQYTLRFPNREVEIGFAQNLLPLYAPPTGLPGGQLRLMNFQDDLFDGHPDTFMRRLETLFRDLPGEDHSESTYRAITYLLCLLSGTEAMPERHSYRGRSDLEVLTPDFVYVFEFKFNRSAREAIDQIHSRDYAGRYAMDPRKLFLIGANINEDKHDRSIEYIIEDSGKR